MRTEVSSAELQLSESAISPNSDGIADTTTFRFKVRRNDKWKLILRDAYTEQVWEKFGTGSPTAGVVWNGMGSNDKLVSDGELRGAAIYYLTPKARHISEIAKKLRLT